MKIITKSQIDKLNTNYVWYACYGSNINYDRFVMYINGGKHASKLGCKDKSRPLDYKKYIIKHPIYFAGESKNWTGGMAFLDYESDGKSYGKLYKIKIEQFMDIFKQEPKLYDAVVLLDYIDQTPVLTFTAKKKLNSLLNEPSDRYKNIIIEGLKELRYNLLDDELDIYLSNQGVVK